MHRNQNFDNHCDVVVLDVAAKSSSSDRSATPLRTLRDPSTLVLHASLLGRHREDAPPLEPAGGGRCRTQRSDYTGMAPICCMTSRLLRSAQCSTMRPSTTRLRLISVKVIGRP